MGGCFQSSVPAGLSMVDRDMRCRGPPRSGGERGVLWAGEGMVSAREGDYGFNAHAPFW